MLKKENGVTMIALAVTIAVLIIISTIALKGGFSTTSDSRYYKGVAELRAMQAEVNRIYEEYKGVDEETKSKLDAKYGKEPAPSSLKSLYDVVVSTNVNDENLGEFKDYKYYSQSFIKDTLNLDGIDNDYIVNLTTRSVICVENIEKSGKVYHALCQIQGEEYNVNYNNTVN